MTGPADRDGPPSRDPRARDAAQGAVASGPEAAAGLGEALRAAAALARARTPLPSQALRGPRPQARQPAAGSHDRARGDEPAGPAVQTAVSEPAAVHGVPPTLSDPALSGVLPRRASEGRMRSTNRLIGVLLVGIVLLAPLPVGSNRPTAWMLWSTVLYAAAAFYLLRATYTGSLNRMNARRFAALLLPPVLLFAYAALQLLPIAGWLPEALLRLPPTGAPAPDTISLAPGAGRIGLLRMTASFLFFVLMLEVSGRLERARAIATALFVGITLYAIWGIVALKVLGDVHFWGPKEFYRAVATGPFVNRNSFATFLGMGAVLGLAMIIERSRNPRQRRSKGDYATSPESVTLALMWSGLGLILLCLVATQSRMGLFATILALIAVVMVSPRKPIASASARPRRVWWIALGLALLVGLALYASSGVIERGLFVLQNANIRAEIYRQTLAMLADRPWTGFGLDSFALAFEMYHKPALPTHLVWELPHSSYLTLWSDFGVIFGSLLLVSAVAAAVYLVRLLAGRHHDVALPVTALAVLALNAVHSLVDFSLEMQANLFVFLAILALGISRRRQPVQTAERHRLDDAPVGAAAGAKPAVPEAGD